ncbi:hypothetical protein BRC92_01645 [Halobacteriales archaeon QS_4_69_31]|nr:MAG: hypothetical protein BRC92_01645 [Halobacteriales archaeon QS_4_69_31]
MSPFSASEPTSVLVARRSRSRAVRDGGQCPGRAPNPRSPHDPGSRRRASGCMAAVAHCNPMSAALCPAKPPGRRRWYCGGSL